MTESLEMAGGRPVSEKYRGRRASAQRKKEERRRAERKIRCAVTPKRDWGADAAGCGRKGENGRAERPGAGTIGWDTAGGQILGTSEMTMDTTRRSGRVFLRGTFGYDGRLWGCEAGRGDASERP